VSLYAKDAFMIAPTVRYRLQYPDERLEVEMVLTKEWLKFQSPPRTYKTLLLAAQRPYVICPSSIFP